MQQYKLTWKLKKTVSLKNKPAEHIQKWRILHFQVRLPENRFMGNFYMIVDDGFTTIMQLFEDTLVCISIQCFTPIN